MCAGCLGDFAVVLPWFGGCLCCYVWFCGVDSICRWIAWLLDLSFVTFDWWLVVVDSGVVLAAGGLLSVGFRGCLPVDYVLIVLLSVH